MELTEQNILAYAMRFGLAQAGDPVRALAGGVSNEVLQVGGLVFKQALPKLRVREEWLASPERIFIEADAADWVAQLLPGQSPQVRHRDRENGVIAIDFMPGEVWKAQLMSGVVSTTAAEAVGSMMGRIHRESARDPEARTRFKDRQPFYQLRIHPYLETVADRHPDVAPAIRRMAETLMTRGEVLVHGDFSPKNILLAPGTGQPILLDFEVAHWGDPCFDTAFCLNHLCLKAAKFPERRRAYLASAEILWQAYAETYGAAARPGLERDTVELLGALMLARVDGKSPAEYLKTPGEQDWVRQAARKLLLDPAANVPEVLERLEKELGEHAH